MLRKLLALAVLTTAGCGSTIINDHCATEQFDMWAYNPKTIEEFDALPLSNQERWTWLIHRREEIGICFEDEYLDEYGKCQLEE